MYLLCIRKPCYGLVIPFFCFYWFSWNRHIDNHVICKQRSVFPFPICVPFVAFSYRITLARTSRIMCKRNGERDYLCLKPDLSRKALSFLPLRMIQVFYRFFKIKLRKILSFLSLLEVHIYFCRSSLEGQAHCLRIILRFVSVPLMFSRICDLRVRTPAWSQPCVFLHMAWFWHLQLI